MRILKSWLRAFWEKIRVLNNFTPRAQQIVSLAIQEAHRLNHNFVGTEHVLIGLTRLGQLALAPAPFAKGPNE